MEPTVVIFNTLWGMSPGDVTLAPTTSLTIRPEQFRAGEIPLPAGSTFWIEWRGEEQRWVRRARFDDDVSRVGGFSVILPDPEPRQPSPTVPQSQGARRQANQPPVPPHGGASPNAARPPQPPQHTADLSESEMAQLGRSRPPLCSDIYNHEESPPPPPVTQRDLTTRPYRRGEPLVPEHEAIMEYTVGNVLNLLRDTLHNLLEASFQQTSETVTILAYKACHYVGKLETLQEARQREASEQVTLGLSAGNCPSPLPDNAEQVIDPATVVFRVQNPLLETEATLMHLGEHHHELPNRHLRKELLRLDGLVQDAKAMMASWGRDPRAPSSEAGISSLKNALQSLTWAQLAVEEGSILQTSEALQAVLQAVQRGNASMQHLLEWLSTKFTGDVVRGSPSPKKRKLEERASGSAQAMQFQDEGAARFFPFWTSRRRLRVDVRSLGDAHFCRAGRASYYMEEHTVSQFADAASDAGTVLLGVTPLASNQGRDQASRSPCAREERGRPLSRHSRAGQRRESHRRRRMHAAFAPDTDDSDPDAED
ncbi:unnamed protein product [Symbiodinium sp. CCMP2456]|nr:unnamed protein product [Symbiodinium sp. CCMP2456]